MSEKRKHSRRREGRRHMDRRVGDRRANGIPPAPDTPGRNDTGERRRSSDHKASPLSGGPEIGREVP